jgi:hypothetical protein
MLLWPNRGIIPRESRVESQGRWVPGEGCCPGFLPLLLLLHPRRNAQELDTWLISLTPLFLGNHILTASSRCLPRPAKMALSRAMMLTILLPPIGSLGCVTANGYWQSSLSCGRSNATLLAATCFLTRSTLRPWRWRLHTVVCRSVAKERSRHKQEYNIHYQVTAPQKAWFHDERTEK